MSEAGVDEDVSRDKLEEELQGIEDSIDEMETRIKDIEDRDMMAQLESLSLEEEVQEVEELLNHMDKEELEKRLNMVEQIKEEYQEGKVHEKLEYLYRQIKDLKEGQFDAEGAASNVDQLQNRMDQLEEQIKSSNSGGGSTEIPEKYKKAVKSNYNELKKLRKELKNNSDEDSEDKSSVDDSKISELEKRIDSLEKIRERLQQMEEDGEVVFVEEQQDDRDLPKTDDNLSSLEFDLKSIKSRISKLEKKGTGSRVDQTNVQSLRKKVKKLERKTVTEEELEELRDSIENQLRKLDSEIDRAVNEGEERLQNLEQLLDGDILDELEGNESNLSERIDSLMDIILDNQDYLEQLDNEVQNLDQRQSNKVDEEQLEKIQSEISQAEKEIEEEDLEVNEETIRKLRSKVKEIEKEVTERDGIELENLKRKVEELDENSSDEKSDLEEKIDNLADHVMRNQEKLHKLEEKIETKNSAPPSDDVTIIS